MPSGMCPRRGVPMSRQNRTLVAGPACRPAPASRPRAGAKPATFTGSAAINALIDRVAPAVLALLADGVPRTKGVIVQALARQHAAGDVALALIRLSATGELEQIGSKYTLATGGAGPPEAA